MKILEFCVSRTGLTVFLVNFRETKPAGTKVGWLAGFSALVSSLIFFALGYFNAYVVYILYNPCNIIQHFVLNAGRNILKI